MAFEVLRDHELRDLKQADDHVLLRIANNGAEHAVRARFVVGCDGAHSMVRKLAGIAFHGTEPTELLRLCDLRLPHQLMGPSGWRGGRPSFIPLAGGFARIVTKESIPPGFDRESPITFDEFRESVRRVHGVELPEVEVRCLSRFTDSSRLAEQYRAGRVLLAGDSAHVHLPAGGPGINAGINDALNLGWKLARTVRGTAPEALLDTYHYERHPMGERLMMNTRAQGALLHANLESAALRELMGKLMRHGVVIRELVDLLQGTDVRYDVGSAHPLAGAWAPDLLLRLPDGSSCRTHQLMTRARALLIDLAGRPKLLARAIPYSGDVDTLQAKCDDPPADLFLVRPDGHVAWVAERGKNDASAIDGLERALASWFTPSRSPEPNQRGLDTIRVKPDPNFRPSGCDKQPTMRRNNPPRDDLHESF